MSSCPTPIGEPRGDGLTLRAFAYERPTTLAEAHAILARDGEPARDGDRVRPLAGGTDLIIRLRDGTARPAVVMDLKRIVDLRDDIGERDGHLVIGARATMTDVAADPRIRRDHPALVEGALVVGSVQIRNRATLVGNQCNASPAADTAPALLVDDATIVAVGAGGERRIPLDAFFVRSGVTALAPGELVTAIELPRPTTRRGSVHLRRTRRRGHDLASVTLACSVDAGGLTRIAFGSVGPRPVLVVDRSGVLADPSAHDDAKRARLAELFVDAAPSPTSMRASPDYRLAMLHVLGARGVRIAIERLRAAA
jgi:carbon-monoxide dehydrogenase medium subunit